MPRPIPTIRPETFPAELAGLAAKAPQLWRTASVDLDSLEITIDAGGSSAIAVGDAQLLATKHNGEVHSDTRKVTISFEKIDGDWRIVSLTADASA